MAGINGGMGYNAWAKKDEERLARQKAKNPTNVQKAKSLASKYSGGVSGNNVASTRVTRKPKKWYAGDNPTGREVVSRIYSLTSNNPDEQQRLLNMYAENTRDRGHVLYNPYAQASNIKAVEGLKALGVEVPDTISDAWIDDMWRQYGKYSRETTSSYGPSAPTSKSTRENDIAYWVNTLLEDKDTTNLAESQVKGLYNEVKYYADLGYSDSEIMKRVRDDFGDKYNVLNKMDEERMVGSAVRLNRAVDYSGDDTIYGMIWAARNNGGTGNYFTDAVNYTMRNGNRYKHNPDSEAALDPTNYDGYDPYSRGGTMHDLQMKYGVTGFDQAWLDANRAAMVATPEGSKEFERIVSAVENHDKAVAELAELDKWLTKKVERGATMDAIAAELTAMVKNGGGVNLNIPTLKKMEDERYAGTYLALSGAVPFTLPQYIEKAQTMIEERDAAAEQAAAEEANKPTFSEKFTEGAKNVIGGIGRFLASMGIKGVGSFGEAIDDALAAQEGAADTNAIGKNMASNVLGVTIHGDLNAQEQAAIEDMVAKVQAATQNYATPEQIQEAEASIAAVENMLTMAANDPARQNQETYENSEAWTSVVEGMNAEPREGMIDMVAEPTAYVEGMTTAEGEHITTDDQMLGRWATMLQGGEWDGSVIDWAAGKSTNSFAIKAELGQGLINHITKGAQLTGLAKSWWDKFGGLVDNLGGPETYDQLDRADMGLDDYDSRTAYGTQVAKALQMNQDAYDIEAIEDSIYVNNLIAISSIAEGISGMTDGKRATDEQANRYIQATRTYETLQKVIDNCMSGKAKKQEELDADLQQRQAASQEVLRQIEAGEPITDDAAYMDIMLTDTSELKANDKVYADTMAFFERTIGYDAISDDGIAFTTGDAGMDASYGRDYLMAEGAALYSKGVTALAQSALEFNLKCAASCGMSLEQFYQAFPTFARTPGQMVAAARSEYNGAWGEFGHTLEGLVSANDSILNAGADVEGVPESEQNQDALDFSDLFALSFDKVNASNALNGEKALYMMMHGFKDEETERDILLTQYGDRTGVAAEWDKTIAEYKKRKAGGMDYEEWRAVNPDNALDELMAKRDTAKDILDLGDPAKWSSQQAIVEKTGNVAYIDKLVAEHGSEFDKQVFDGVTGLMQTGQFMYQSIMLGGGYTASLAATLTSSGGEAYDRFMESGDYNAAVAASIGAWLMNAAIETSLDRFAPAALGGDREMRMALARSNLAKMGVFKWMKDPKSMSKAARSIADLVIGGTMNVGGESVEEALQALVDITADNIVYGNGILPTGEQLGEVFQAGKDAIWMSIIMEGGSNMVFGKPAITDYAGNAITKAEAQLLPENDGVVLNTAINFEATAMAITNSQAPLDQIANSSENQQLQDIVKEMQIVDAEVAEAETGLQVAIDNRAAAAAALEAVDNERVESDVFTEDMSKRMVAAATEIQSADQQISKSRERAEAAKARKAEVQKHHDELKAKVQGMYNQVMDEAKAKYAQMVTDKYFAGDSEAQQAAGKAYLEACQKLQDAKNNLRSAKAEANMYKTGTPYGDSAYTAYGEALLEIDRLTEEVEAAKAAMDAAYAETAEGKVEAEMNTDLVAAQQAADEAQAAAEADPMNMRKQLAADHAQAQLEAIQAQQELEGMREGISQRLNSPDSKTRDAAVADWKAAQQKASDAAATAQALEAEFNETDTQKNLRAAIDNMKQYTNEQLVMDDAEGHQDAVRAYNELQLARADAEVENQLNALNAAETGSAEHNAAMAAYNEALTARENEVGRQLGVTGDAVRASLKKSSLGTQVLDAVQRGNQQRASTIIKQILDTDSENRGKLIQQAVKHRQAFQLNADMETGAQGKAGVTHAYSRQAKKNLSKDSRLQLDVLNEVAKDAGFEIVVKDSLSNVEGAVNGVLSKGGTIYIGLDAIEQGYLQAGTHEMVHGIRRRDNAAYGELKQVVTDILKEQGLDIDQMVQDRISSYDRLGQTINADDALEEIVAESAAQIWGSEANMQKFAEEHPNAFKRAYDAFMNFWTRVRDISNRIAGRNDRKEITAMLSDDGALQKVYDTFMKVAKETNLESEIQQDAEAEELSDADVKFSLRDEPPPKNTGIAYKVFFEKDGKLYPPMVANPGGADTPVGVWLNADIGVAAPPSKTGRMQVKAGGKGTQGGSGSLAFRPGWHLGDVPKATQFNRLNPETGVKELFPANFVWAECEYAADVDYQEEAMSYGYTENGKFRHSYAGLPRLPENGYYRYRTNPNPDTVPWIITGAMKVNRILSHEEVDAILAKKGIEPTKWQEKLSLNDHQWNEHEPAIPEESMVNEYRGALDRAQWRRYYKRLNESREYDTSAFAPGDRTIMVIDGNLIAMKMQTNREFTVTGVYRGDGIEYNGIKDDNIDYLINKWIGDSYGEENIANWAAAIGYDDGEPLLRSYDKYNGWAVPGDGAEEGSGSGTSGIYQGRTYRDGVLESGAGETGESLSLNESAWNQDIANDLAEQLVNNTGNAAQIADILGRMEGDMWRDHRAAGRTGVTTTADRNPIEILSDLTSRIRVGYNPGGSMNEGNRRLPRAVQGFYNRHARSITTRTSTAGDLEIGLHEFGHAVQQRLPNLHANQQLLNGLSQGVRNAYDPRELDGEAIAEFVVDYIFNRDEAIRQAGAQFVQDFEDMMANDRDLYEAVTEASHQTELWNNADVGSKMDAMIKEGNDPRRGQIGNGLQRLARNIETAVADLTAPADLVSRDFRRSALYSMHASRRADVSLTRFLIDPQGRNIGQSLAERFYRAGVTEDDQAEVSRYALARHALDRRRQNKDVFNEAEFPTADLEAYIADVEANHPNIVAGADALTSFWNDFMDAWWVGTGMIDADDVATMRAMYPHYVPTFRVVGENFNQYGGRSSRFQIRGAVRGGSSLEVIDPIASIVKMTQQMTSTVTQNQLMREFHNEWRRGGLGEIADDVTQDYRVQRNDTTRLQGALDAIAATGAVDPALMDDAYAQMLNLQERWYGTGQNYDANVVSGVDENGNRFFYKIKDRGLYNLLSGTAGRNGDMGAILRTMRDFKNVFTKLTTGSNPLFALKNLQRDIQASVNTGTHSLTYADGMYHWLRAFHEVLTGSDTYREWQAMGGGEHTRFSTELNGREAGAVVRELGRDLMRGRVNRRGDFKTRNTALENISNVLTWEQLNNAVENASRYVEYRFGRHNLGTDAGRREAFMASQDVTTNFGTHGASGTIKVLNQVVPFMNATIQGLNKDVNIIRDALSGDANRRRQAAPKAAKTLMNTALTAALQYALLKMFGSNEDDEDYALLSQEMRTGNLIIPIGKGAMEELGDVVGFDKPYIRIPIAQGPLAQGMYAKALDLVADVTNYSPMEVDLWRAAKSILSDSIPDGTVFQAISDAKNNRTWYGGEIESEYMRNYSATNRYDSDTPRAIVELGQTLNVSPAKLDYLLNQYSGFAGKIIMPLLSTGRLNGEGGLDERAKNLAYNVLKNYTIDPVSSNDLSTSYTAAKATISQILADGKAGKPMGDLAYSADPEEAYGAAEYLSKEFTALDKEIAALWSEYNAIKDSDLSDGDKARQMRDIRRNYIVPLQQDAMALYEEYKMQYIDADSLALELYGQLPGGLNRPTLD